MRIALSLVLLSTLCLWAEEPPRYGVPLDTKAYPQSSAKEALTSVLKAIDAKKFDYLVAHLASPAFIDSRVKTIYGGKFEEQVQDTRARLDPATVKQLRLFLKEGKWTTEKDSALVQLEDVKDRCVRLLKKGERWYLDHNFSPPGP